MLLARAHHLLVEVPGLLHGIGHALGHGEHAGLAADLRIVDRVEEGATRLRPGIDDGQILGGELAHRERGGLERLGPSVQADEARRDVVDETLARCRRRELLLGQQRLQLIGRLVLFVDERREIPFYVARELDLIVAATEAMHSEPDATRDAEQQHRAQHAVRPQ